jgi:hypothetical protein
VKIFARITNESHVRISRKGESSKKNFELRKIGTSKQKATRRGIAFPYHSFQRVVPAGNGARHFRKYEIEILFFCTTATIFDIAAVIFK